MICSVFVYGTLKRGESRENLWPAPPDSVRPGWVWGELYCRRAYPALRPGGDRIRGEIWTFPAETMPAVIEQLDRIEGTDQRGQPNLYDRVEIEVFEPDQDPPVAATAISYHYATDPELEGFDRLPPDESGYVEWSGCQ